MQLVTHEVASDAEKLRALHVPGTPLLLANVWDPVTARAVESVGMKAIATASAAVAPANGYEDHGNLPPEIAFKVLRQIAQTVSLPVTADIEDGYGLAPEAIAEQTIRAGVCGINIEDTDHAAGILTDIGRQADLITKIKAAAYALGVNLVINARTDVQIHGRPSREGLERAQRYFNAGADCVFPILISDISLIRDYVSLGDTNVLWRPGGPTLREFISAGVSRISLGPLLLHVILRRLREATNALQKFDEQSIWR